MERILQIRKLLARSQRMPWVVLGLTLAILAGAILVITEQTRTRIRAQITGRDREILHAVARMKMPQPGQAQAEDWVGSIEDPANQLTVVLETSRLSGVMGASLFSPKGEVVQSFPADLLEGTLSASDLAALRSLKPVSRFYSSLPMSEIFLPDRQGRGLESKRELPVLEVSVPLHTGNDSPLLGIAQFVIEGYSIAQEFAQLDRNLWRQGLSAFLAGAVILILAISWSFRRLNRAHRLLAERTENLLKANQELTLAAKTSAVGAVTSHLIHGLKNPLAGLQTFVAGLGASVAEHPVADLEHAIATTRRMQALINEVLTVLHEEQGAGQYEIALTELVELITGKVQTLCRQHEVRLIVSCETEVVLPNRVANLVALILANLVQNAIEATPPAGEACLRIAPAGEDLLCEVRDQGTGFPKGARPFVPCPSQKEGGSGIGLAISKQLANHLGAGLELRASSSAGCVFGLTLPTSLWKPKTSSVTVTLS